ncbi:peptidylprolyl isomerase [Phytohalomonas tamaricis]|uniref:peptidylprolyl isomerase n=1 Tax=Phytohalomonas tamaricis TaxID=2081032 RepID=UPI000D0B62D0|nr:peptidylprolyl isomerase [Phytohalomonas tamaricis]
MSALRKFAIAPLGMALALALTPMAEAAVQPLDQIVAVVNKDAIMQSDLDRRVTQVRQQMAGRNIPMPSDEVLRRQVLDRMITEQIELQMAQKANLTVDDEQLNRALRDVAAQNDMSLEQFADTLEREGMSIADVREQVRREMLISQVQQHNVASQVRISDREVDQYLDNAGSGANVQYHLAHILVAVPQSPTPEQVEAARHKAEALRQQIVTEHADFQQVAAGQSNGGEAFEGGDLGWRPRAELPTIFADVVPGMTVGEVSEPIRSPSGFHLVKLVEKRGDTQQMIEQVKARHILVSPNPNRSDEQAKQLATQLHDRIASGEDFATLAQQYSDDKGSALNGGELGWVNPGESVPAFEQALSSLSKGELSQPVHSRFGWHVIQLEDRRQRDVTASNQRDQIRRTLFQRKANEELEAWLQQIRAEAYIDNRLEDDSASANNGGQG